MQSITKVEITNRIEFFSDSLISGFSAQGFQVPGKGTSSFGCFGTRCFTIAIFHIGHKEDVDWSQNRCDQAHEQACNHVRLVGYRPVVSQRPLTQHSHSGGAVRSLVGPVRPVPDDVEDTEHQAEDGHHLAQVQQSARPLIEI